MIGRREPRDKSRTLTLRTFGKLKARERAQVKRHKTQNPFGLNLSKREHQAADVYERIITCNNSFLCNSVVVYNGAEPVIVRHHGIFLQQPYVIQPWS